MAHADWKRYYAIVYDAPAPTYAPLIFRERGYALACLETERAMCNMASKTYPTWPKPIGIVRIRGRKHNAKLQTWLKEHAI